MGAYDFDRRERVHQGFEFGSLHELIFGLATALYKTPNTFMFIF